MGSESQELIIETHPMNLAELNIELCPKCGRDDKSCAAFKTLKRHFFPKSRGGWGVSRERVSLEERRKRKLITNERWREKNRDRINAYQKTQRIRKAAKDRPCKGCSRQREIGLKHYCQSCRPVMVDLTWKAAHKAAKNRRKARLNGNGGTFTGQEWMALCEKFGNRCLGPGCQVVGQENLTVDHVIPLAKGGRNEISNIQPLCHACNVRKSDKVEDYRLQEVAV